MATAAPSPPFAGQAPEDAFRMDAEPGRYGGTLALALPQNPRSFNPILASETSTFMVINQVVYKALTDYDNQAQRDVPGLAKSWETTPDGLNWTFHLRRGVQWSDGAPFNAGDALFTFQVTCDARIAAAGRDLLAQSDDSCPAIEKLDQYTIRFSLKEPNALFLGAVGGVLLIPRHKWESAYRAGQFNQTMLLNTDPKEIVGLGPYRMQTFVTDQRVVLERNPHYWKVDSAGNRLPYIDRVVFVIVPDVNAEVLKFQQGEIDMLWGISPETVELLKRDEQKGDYKVYDLGPSFNTEFLVFNQDTRRYKNQVKLKWFREPRFRRAVSYAIDREALARAVFLGYATPIYGYTSPANKLWHSEEIPKYPHDPEKAKALLREIGIEDRNGDGKLEDAADNPIRFSINTNANRAARVNIGALIKEQLAQIGMEVSFQPLDFNLLIDRLASTRDFDAIVLGWQAAVPPDPINNKNALLPGGSNYAAFPGQKAPFTEWEMQLQSLLLENARSNDLARRRQSFAAAMRIWSEYLPEIDLVAAKSLVAARNRFGNFKPSPLANYTYWNVDELYFTR
ncbi:MAG: ABC transporter substrate-binding protein [Blastocatellia bacterium]